MYCVNRVSSTLGSEIARYEGISKCKRNELGQIDIVKIAGLSWFIMFNSVQMCFYKIENIMG